MAYERKKASFDWLALWILFSAWSSLSGWCLSVLSFLNPIGVIASYGIFFTVVFSFRDCLNDGPRHALWRVFRARFVVPKIWFGLALLAFIGGLFYSPSNYDYLTYRFARVLYWASNHGWTWIPTVDQRINYSGTGFEWLMAPLLVLFQTDRLFFLINFISYLFLPGLVFSVFSKLGISKRIGWWWMWVFPSGYCYILQAASAGNDSFAVIYLLAALHYLFAAKTASTTKNLVISCLSIALLTGAKASNLPLVLPWVTVLFFHRVTFLENSRWATVALAMILAAAVSFLPMALLNIHYTGNFAGDPDNSAKLKISNPASGVLGNSLQAMKDNLSPPIFPHAINWGPLLPSQFRENLRRNFPRLDLNSEELQIEENAGLGLGIVLFCALFIVAGIRDRLARTGMVVARNRMALWVVGAGLIAWFGYLTKMGSEATSRLIAAYYPLLVAGVLVAVSLDGRVMRRFAFKGVGLLAMLSAFPLVILNPARPLFPVQALSTFLAASHVSPEVIARYNQVYEVYAARTDVFAGLTASIPPSERTIGFLQAGNDPEASLWRPLGSRKVIEVTSDDSAQAIRAQGIHYLVVSDDALADRYHTTIGVLMTKWSASLVDQKEIILTIHSGAKTWYLLHL
jgi:hypothetical protein